MMNEIKKKLNNKIVNRSGETIGETLVALLIAALALTMLAGAIVASSNMIRSSRDNLKKYYNTSENLATFSVSDEKTIYIAGEECKITFAENNAFSRIPVIAYKKK